MDDRIFYGVWAAAGLAMLIFYSKRKHPVSSALAGMTSGAAALLMLHFFGAPFGISPPLNLFSTMVSLILGVPGAILAAASGFVP